MFPVRAMWKWKWTILAVTLAAGAISLALSMARTVKYEAIALLASEVHQVGGEAADPRVLENYIELTRQALLMHAELLKAEAAIAAVAQSSRAGDREGVRIRLRAEVRREPIALQIAAWDEEPQQAAALANAAANYAMTHASATNRRIDVDAQSYLDKLRAEFDTRLALEAQTLAQTSIQVVVTKRQHRINMLHDEVLKLEKLRNQVGWRAEELSSIDRALSMQRDQLNQLLGERDIVNRTLERLGRETRLAAMAYESVHSEYVESSLSVVSRMADLKLLKAAEVPRAPMARHLNIIAAIGVLCGLMIGAMIALYVEHVRALNGS